MRASFLCCGLFGLGSAHAGRSNRLKNGPPKWAVEISRHGSDPRFALRATTYDIGRQLAVILLQHHVESPQLMQVFEHLMA